MKTAIIDTATAGDNIIVAGVAGKILRVYGYILFSAQANYMIWKSGSTPISGQMHMSASSSAAMHLGDNWPAGGMPVLSTAAGEGLVLYLNAAHVVGGHITYGEISV